MKNMFLHDLKVACRSLLKYKLQTVISVIGLAVGLTCFLVCNIQLRDVLMKNRRLPDADNIYVLAPKGHNGVRIEQKFAKEVKDKFPEIKKFISFIGDVRTSKKCVVEHDGGKRIEEEDFLYSDGSFMDFFDFKLLQGNLDVVKNQPDAVILTESAAIRLFGTTDVLGKTFIDVDDWSSEEKENTVAGVMADFPLQTDIEQNAGVVLNTTDKYIKRIWPIAVKTYFRIHENIPIEDLNRKIAIYLEKRFGTEDRLSSLNFNSISKLSSYSLSSSLAMSGIGLLVLLTAIFNYVMFMSGRILNRQKEYGVRQITGASSRSIFRMFATEITLSIGVVIFLSLILIELLIHVFSGESSYSIFDDRQNWLLILGGYLLEYALLVWLGMLGICWSILKRFRLQTTLQHIQGGGVRYKNRLSKFLLGLQLTICLLLSGGTYFLYAQEEFVMEKFHGKISIETCNRIHGFYLYGEKLKSIKADFQNMVNANPYIESSCWSYNRLLSPEQMMTSSLKMEGMKNELSENPAYNLDFMITTANYPEFINARMEEGRFFRADEFNSAVVNREFIRWFGMNPLGKDIETHFIASIWKTYHVVGIIEDVLPVGRGRKLKPCIYLHSSDGDVARCYVKLIPGAKLEVLKSLEAKIKEQVNTFPPEVETLEEDIASSTEEIQAMSNMLGLFALICIIICLLGIYSSMMLAVEKRGREMAIRKINGARLLDIGRIFVRHYFVLLGIAALIAFPALYLGVQTWLESYEYRISISPFPFIAIFVLLFAIVLLTIGSQLIKIMRINPVEKLKSE